MNTNECQHRNRAGDNYGMSCIDCGKQLAGYGYGGWFGNELLTPTPKCIHSFYPMGEGGAEVCIYCENFRNLPEVKQD